MRLLKRDERKGITILLPEDVDDLWALYIIVEPGDIVRARTTRERRSRGEGQRGKRVSAGLGVEVEKKALDMLMRRLRLLGKIREAPRELEDELGKHHALSIRPGTALEVQKERWSHFHLKVMERACSARPKPLIVVCLDDEDYCIALVGLRDVDVLAEGVNTALAGAPSKEEALKAFFSEALEALKRAWEERGRPIAVIGPSLERGLFIAALRRERPELAGEVVSTKGVSTGGLPGIYEALRAGVLKEALSRARIVREIEAVNELLARLGRGDGRVAYGLDDVRAACSVGAIELLLVSDALLRDADEAMRLELEELMMSVEEMRGGIMIIGSEHEAGRNLLSLGSIAALLRFPAKPY